MHFHEVHQWYHVSCPSILHACNVHQLPELLSNNNKINACSIVWADCRLLLSEYCITSYFRITSPVPALPCIAEIHYQTIIHYYITALELKLSHNTVGCYWKCCVYIPLDMTLHYDLVAHHGVMLAYQGSQISHSIVMSVSGTDLV